MPIRLLLREFRISVVSSSPSTPRSQSARRTPIFQRDPSYLHNPLYQAYSASGLLKLSRCKEEDCYLGQRHHCNGLDTPSQSCASAVPQTDIILSPDPLTRLYVSGMLRLVLPLGSL